MKKLKSIFILSLILSCLVILLGGVWIYNLNSRITEGLAQKKFLPPTEYYANPTEFSTQSTGQIRNLIQKELISRNYRHRDWEQKLFPGDFSDGNLNQCQSFLTEIGQTQKNDQGYQLSHLANSCLLFSVKATGDAEIDPIGPQLLIFDSEDKLIEIRLGGNFEVASSAKLEPELIAQYLQGQPISQHYHPLGEIPTQCLNAVLAIEDAKFLEHSGFSYTGFARAILSHTVGFGIRQGGSTITQQLVKNYFLTSERTIKRKAIEFAMSLILEAHASKDEILETYLNVIYMGQNGPFQIRGFGAASQFYFNKPIDQLELHECSLLAAVLNSPGLFDPYKKPENAKKRRSLVLERMLDQKMITEDQAAKAKQQSLPSERRIAVAETAPYYIHAANVEIEKMGLELLGLKIFTGLSLTDQQSAQEAVRNQLNNLESNNSKIRSLKEKNQTLEGVLISTNNSTGLISAIVGGRSYRLTQFNRAIDGHRQIGSIMKPFVYLTALMQSESSGQTFDPLTTLSDTKFSYKYEGQSWSPENYGKKYFGQVPAYFALKNSLNAATASLGLQVGIEKVADTAKSLGVTSNLEKVPSLSLGAFELYPMEVARAYSAIARFGKTVELGTIRGITNELGAHVYKRSIKENQTVDPVATASLISMMKQTTQTGTARLIAASGFKVPAAGKTGTTSDNRDAWFAGFTPRQTTVVWVGYDTPTANGLTGASGAVPIWLDFMKRSTINDPLTDFAWPEGTEVRTVDRSEIDAESDSKVDKKVDLKFELVFRK